MKKLVLILILCLACLGGLEAQNYWKPIGMQGIFLGVSPDGSIYSYYGGSGNGPCFTRSQDEGETWQVVLGYETGFNCNLNWNCFSVSPEGRIFLFEGYPYRAFYSDDNGDSWQLTSGAAPLTAGDEAQRICAVNNDTLVGSASSHFVFWTTDGGATWDTIRPAFVEDDQYIGNLLANGNGDVFFSLNLNDGGDSGQNIGVYHATLSDMDNWELVAFQGVAINDMEFDPEGNVVCNALVSDNFDGFEHVPGFYAFGSYNTFGISDNGIVYKSNVTENNTAVLAYSFDHGETFTEVGEELALEPPIPGGTDGFLCKGYDNHLYFKGRGSYWKSRCVADDIPGFNPWLGAQFLDEASSLYYSIISTEPPRVSVVGHVDGENAQGELDIPETVEYEGVTFMVTRIGREAFKNCAGLTGQLVIPSTVDTIQPYAFRSCRGFMGDLIIPNSVHYLGAGAFQWCTGFDGSLVLPETITVIETWTFEGCIGLSGTLNIPASVTRIEPAAFGFCTGFTGTLIIPESVTELSTPVPPVNGIRGAFEECTGFTGLVLPESLRIIGGGNGGGCFAFCTGLVGELLIPDKVKEIGYMAFYACHGLTGELHLPDSLQSIGYEAFSLCDGFTGRLVFPNALESIGNGAFAGCSGFSDVELHHEVFYQNNFGDAVFTGWSIDSLELPEGWTTTGRYTFERCGNLRTVHLPESLTMIEITCFQECSALTEINLPTNLTVIEQGAFDGCSSLISVELPANLNQLGAYALRNCTSLTGELVVPDLVERIEQLTFAGCTNLNRIVLGNSVNTINDNAFKDMEFDTLVIKAMTPPVLRHFPNQGLPFDQLVIVPCGTLEAYQNAEGWNDFTNIIEDCGTGLVGFSGAEWYYEIQNLNGSITYQHLEYAADTTVNHKDVQIIIRTNTLYDKDGHSEVTREYIYEEDGLVYWWNGDLQEFTVLYDLGAQVGDSWVIKVGTETLTMHVDAVNYYHYGDQTFRLLEVSDENDIFSGSIVCGIGHLTSFFPERLMTRGKGYRVEGMRCYWRDGDLFFKYGEEDCDAIYKEWHNGIGEDGPSAGSGILTVYPNPTHSVLIVETCHGASLQTPTYRIINLMGQTLMTGTLTAETQQIDVTSLPEGMYFISVGDVTRKFIVNK